MNQHVQKKELRGAKKVKRTPSVSPDRTLLKEFGRKHKPYGWGNITKAYLKLSPEEKRNLTEEEKQDLIAYYAKGAKGKRVKEKEKKKQKQKETKAKLKQVRDDPRNKHQEWNPKEKQNWSVNWSADDLHYDGLDKDDIARGETKVHVRKPRILTSYQYDPEKAFLKLISLLEKDDKTTLLKEIGKDINRDLGATMLRTSYGPAKYKGEEKTNEGVEQSIDDQAEIVTGENDEGSEDSFDAPENIEEPEKEISFADGTIEKVDNNPEFSSGFVFGKGTVPGQDLSGNDRKKLGLNSSDVDEELDYLSFVGSHTLGLDSQGRTFAQAFKVFEKTWEADQGAVRDRAKEQRKIWRQTLNPKHRTNRKKKTKEN